MNFTDMTQVNKHTQFRRDIRRERLSTDYVSSEKSVKKTSHSVESSLPKSPPRRKIKSKSQVGKEDKSKTKEDADPNDPVEKYGLDASNPPDEVLKTEFSVLWGRCTLESYNLHLVV